MADEVEIVVRLRDELSRNANDAADALDRLVRSAEAAERRLGRVEGAAEGAAGAVDDAGDDAAGAARQVDELGDQAAETARQLEALRRAAANAGAANDALDRAMRRQADAAARGARQNSVLRRALGSTRGVLRGLNEDMAKGRKQVTLLGGQLLKSLKLPAIITAATLIAAAISAIGAAAVGAAGALVPLVGLLGVLPGVMIAVKGVTAAIGAAVKPTVAAADAIKKYGADSKEAAEAMKGMIPEARSFSVALAAARENVEGLRKTAQRGMLPGMEDALRRVQGLLPVVDKGVGQLSAVIGRLAVRASQVVTSPFFKADLGLIATRNARLVGILGDTGITLGDALRHIVVAAGPLLEDLALMVRRGAELTRTWLSNKRATGELAEFFENTQRVFRGVVGTLGDLAVGLVNVLGIGATTGDKMGASIGRLAKDFRDFTNSAEGKNKIAAFFRDAQPVIDETGLLLADLAKGFGGLAANGDLAPLLAQIRTELLPALLELSAGLTTGLGPAIVDLATAAATFANVLSFDPLTTAFTMFADRVQTISKIIQITPGLSYLIALMITLRVTSLLTAAAMRALGVSFLIGRAKMFIGVMKGLILVMRGTTVATIQAGIAQGTYNKAQLLGAKIGAGLAKVFRAVGIAARFLGTSLYLALGPVGLIILAVAAIAVGLYVLYKKSETARRIMQTVFRVIAQGAMHLAEQFLAGIQQMLEGLGKLPGPMGAPFRKGADAIQKMRDKIKGASDDLDSLGRKRTTIQIKIQAGEIVGTGLAANSAGGSVYNSQVPAVQRMADARQIATNVGRAQTAASAARAERLNRSFSGNATYAGFESIVGELGPEVFVPRAGPMRVVGADSPEVARFASSGFIVPAAGTPQALTKPIPGWVQDRLAAAPPPAAVPSYAVAGPRPAPQPSGGDTALLAPLPAPVINVYPQTEMDVEAAVERAYRRLQRREQERR